MADPSFAPHPSPFLPRVGFAVGFTGHGLGWGGLQTAERLVGLLLRGPVQGCWTRGGWGCRIVVASEQGAPMDGQTLVQTHREDILRLAAAHGTYNVRLFGSVVRGEAGPESDVDLLVDMVPEHSLDRIGLWQDLEDLLSCKVDVVTERGLHRLMRKYILAEAVPLHSFAS